MVGGGNVGEMTASGAPGLGPEAGATHRSSGESSAHSGRACGTAPATPLGAESSQRAPRGAAGTHSCRTPAAKVGVGTRSYGDAGVRARSLQLVPTWQPERLPFEENKTDLC